MQRPVTGRCLCNGQSQAAFQDTLSSIVQLLPQQDHLGRPGNGKPQALVDAVAARQHHKEGDHHPHTKPCSRNPALTIKQLPGCRTSLTEFWLGCYLAPDSTAGAHVARELLREPITCQRPPWCARTLPEKTRAQALEMVLLVSVEKSMPVPMRQNSSGMKMYSHAQRTADCACRMFSSCSLSCSVQGK